MSKPDDIPQDIWDKAEEWGDKAKSPARYDRWFARAIMAAKADEREACAKEAEESEEMASCYDIAMQIRNRLT